MHATESFSRVGIARIAPKDTRRPRFLWTALKDRSAVKAFEFKQFFSPVSVDELEADVKVFLFES